jgi:ABC-type polysaccharide/polyol phosphate transport system ATPase subunit
VIALTDVQLWFPQARARAGGVKEAVLAWATGRKRPPSGYHVLRGIDLEVPKGQVLGIVGRNGSGKSTLLRVICGIYQPDRGQVAVRGRISALLELGAGFKEELTGRENVRLSGAIMGLGAAEMNRLMEPIVEFADLGEFMDQPLRTYSSGMRSRLGFSVASVLEPEILLIDEALAVGDASFREKSMSRIEEMVQSDATVVIVSHNTAELERLCHRLVWIDRGRIAADGPPREVLAAYGAKRS